jgi:hypothetical protein
MVIYIQSVVSVWGIWKTSLTCLLNFARLDYEKTPQTFGWFYQPLFNYVIVLMVAEYIKFKLLVTFGNPSFTQLWL